MLRSITCLHIFEALNEPLDFQHRIEAETARALAQQQQKEADENKAVELENCIDWREKIKLSNKLMFRLAL